MKLHTDNTTIKANKTKTLAAGSRHHTGTDGSAVTTEEKPEKEKTRTNSEQRDDCKIVMEPHEKKEKKV